MATEWDNLSAVERYEERGGFWTGGPFFGQRISLPFGRLRVSRDAIAIDVSPLWNTAAIEVQRADVQRLEVRRPRFGLGAQLWVVTPSGPLDTRFVSIAPATLVQTLERFGWPVTESRGRGKPQHQRT